MISLYHCIFSSFFVSFKKLVSINGFDVGQLWTSIDSLSFTRYNHCFKMQFKENDDVIYSNKKSLSKSLTYQKDLDHQTSDLDHKSYLEPQSPLRNADYLFSNDLDILAGASFRTISKGSLEIIPDIGDLQRQCSFRQMACQPIRESVCNLFQELQQLSEHEEELIQETMKLSVRDNSFDRQFSNIAALTSYGQQQSQKGHRSKKFTNPKIRKAKHLMRQFNKFRRQGKQAIIGSFLFNFSSGEVAFKKAKIYLLTDETGSIQKFLIQNGEEDVQIRFQKLEDARERYKLQIWDGSSYQDVKFIGEIQKNP